MHICYSVEEGENAIYIRLSKCWEPMYMYTLLTQSQVNKLSTDI